MRFNPATENQARTIEQLAAETRAVISRLPKPAPLARVWCSLKGGWVIPALPFQQALEAPDNDLVPIA